MLTGAADAVNANRKAVPERGVWIRTSTSDSLFQRIGPPQSSEIQFAGVSGFVCLVLLLLIPGYLY